MNDDFNCKSCSKEPQDRINIMRFINRMDEHFRKNDLAGAIDTVEFWEAEATRLNDTAALLTILNEELGLFRRVQNEEKALRAIKLTLDILNGENTQGSLSRATIFINLATTLSAFGKTEEALTYYEKAEEVYEKSGDLKSYEYATLLNNKSSALTELKRFGEAEENLKRAIEILDSEGKHDVDIALSYLSLAHLYYDRDSNSVLQVEEFIDTAWEYINSKRQAHDGEYAFAISTCVPSFRYFKREIEALALEETAKEIYGGAV